MPATDEDLTMNASREMPKYECHKKVWPLLGYELRSKLAKD